MKLCEKGRTGIGSGMDLKITLSCESELIKHGVTIVVIPSHV